MIMMTRITNTFIYLIYCEKFRKVLQRTEKVSLIMKGLQKLYISDMCISDISYAYLAVYISGMRPRYLIMKGLQKVKANLQH